MVVLYPAAPSLILCYFPEVFLTFAQDKFDEKGKLKDEMTAKFAGQLLQNLVNLARQLKK